MLPIHTILHPTDFSEHSNHACEFACALARDYGCRLVVLHVAMPSFTYGDGKCVVPLEFERLIQEAREKLDHLEAPGANVRTERRLEQGDAVTEILRVAQDLGADLIVMGTHGRTGLDRLMMGSVAEQVLRQAWCPVLTVKAHQTEPVVGTAKPKAVAVLTTRVRKGGQNMAKKDQLLDVGDKKQRQLKEAGRMAHYSVPPGKLPHEIAERANMKRQQKLMHKQDNK